MKRLVIIALCAVLGFAATGCEKKSASAASSGPAMQAMPVQTATVSLQSVPQSSEYVATIKSRRSATLQPQVNGRLTQINVRSGDHVRSGQVLMSIDPLQQQASVEAQHATERQKKSALDFQTIEFERQKKLFEAGITSRDAYQQAQQAYDNAKAEYESSVGTRKMQEEQLAYYTIRAPFDGIVGDIPTHVGDYVSTQTVLTTIDENKDLEAYIYVPTERASQLKMGLEVDLTDTNGKVLEKSKIDFLAPSVDNALQGILVKAPVRSQAVRNAQLVKARVVWSSAPMAVVPVLAVTRQGGQTFVFVARQQNGMYVASQVPVTIGETVGNAYSVQSGLNAGDRVIVSSTQFLMNGMPVKPLGAA